MTKQQMLAFVKAVMANGDGNAALETISPKRSEVVALIATCDTSVEEEATAKAAYFMKRVESNEAYSAVSAMFGKFAEAVDRLYDGDESELTALGFELRDPVLPVGLLPAPANVRATFGPVEGTVRVNWSGVVGKLTYEVEYATDVNGTWTRCYNAGRARHICEGLTPGVEYWFRVRAIGDAGPSAWSNPVRRRAA